MLIPTLAACSNDNTGDHEQSTTTTTTTLTTTSGTDKKPEDGGNTEVIPFDPDKLEGLIARFDASALELKDGDKVTEWENLAPGDKYNAIASSSAKAPTFKESSDINAKNGVAFSKRNGLKLEGSENLRIQEMSIFAVIRANTIDGNSDNNQIFSKLHNAGPWNHNWYFNINGSSYFNFGWKDTDNNYHDCNDPACRLTANTDYILAGVKEGALGTLYVNGTAVGTMPSGTEGVLVNSDPVYIGGPDNMGASMDGTICEIIMFDRSLTNTESYNIYNYLSEKWGVTISTDSFIPEETDITIKVDGNEIREFSTAQTSYKRSLPYGTTKAPTVDATCTLDGKELELEIVQASSVNGEATVTIKEFDAVYTVKFSVLEAPVLSLRSPEVTDVTLADGSFWEELLELYATETVEYSIDNLVSQGAIENFENVIKGSGKARSNPWADGLFFETVTGAADLLAVYPDKALEEKIDKHIDVIYDASMASKNGYLSTHAMLEKPGKYFDETGNARWYHDCYNFGCMAEAGVRYYLATGKTKLLYVSVRFAEFIADNYGYGTRADGTQKINMVPSHSLSEESLLLLYVLLRDNPSLKAELENYSDKYPLSIDENEYADLVKFWIENKGNMDNRLASYGDYAQDHAYYFDQTVAAGHAVRANLFYTGLTAAGLEFENYTYIETAKILFDNIYETQMYVNGCTGATSHEEAYGEAYQLPNDGYGETCASVAMAFYSNYLSLALEDSTYADTLENIMYNSILGGIGLDGKTFHYQQPLNATNSNKFDINYRWEWHDCPCCVPMFLKFVSRMPTYIYSFNDSTVYINQFISSSATLANGVTVTQSTNMPYYGNCTFTVSGKDTELCIRIPQWTDGVSLKVNGVSADYTERNGYAVFNVKDGDTVEYTLEMSARRIYSDSRVAANVGRVAIAYGPIIYCIESTDNTEFANINGNQNALKLAKDSELTVTFDEDLFGGVFVMTFDALDTSGNVKSATAIPYYARHNRGASATYLWIKEA